MSISLELCHETMLCTHWQSSHQSYEEDVPNRVFDCSLLSSCDHQHIGNTTYPTVTNAGTRICLPDPFKRRPCRPACPASSRSGQVQIQCEFSFLNARFYCFYKLYLN